MIRSFISVNSYRYFKILGNCTNHSTVSINSYNLPLLKLSDRIIFSQKLYFSAQKPENEKSPGLLKRFKNAYKQFGKTLIAVHVTTSCLWFASFYTLIHSGIDLSPIFEWFIQPETVIKAQKSQFGAVAMSYLLYKIATPARYAVTIGGTQLTVRQLKKMGLWQEIDETEKIGALFKEGKENVAMKIKKRREKTSNDKEIEN